MFKIRLLLIIMLSLCLCSACLKTASEPEASVEESIGLSEKPGITPENYTFPPDEAELVWAVKEVGINWQIDDMTNLLSSIESATDSSTIALYSISNASGLINSWLNMSYYLPPDDKICLISFNYMEQTPEDYSRFQQQDWPLFWQLAGKLFPAPQAIAALGEQCMAYFNSYPESGLQTQSSRGSLRWCGRQDNIHCSVDFTYNPLFERYVLSDIILESPLSFNANKHDMAASLIEYAAENLKKPCKVAEINLDATGEAAKGFNMVIGQLEQLMANDDILDISKLSLTLPQNTDLYLKALLVDETGSMPVYLAPTSLSQAELAEERLHFVHIIDALEPYCVIDLSVSNADLLK